MKKAEKKIFNFSGLNFTKTFLLEKELSALTLNLADLLTEKSNGPFFGPIWKEASNKNKSIFKLPDFNSQKTPLFTQQNLKEDPVQDQRSFFPSKKISSNLSKDTPIIVPAPTLKKEPFSFKTDQKILHEAVPRTEIEDLGRGARREEPQFLNSTRLDKEQPNFYPQRVEKSRPNAPEYFVRPADFKGVKPEFQYNEHIEEPVLEETENENRAKEKLDRFSGIQNNLLNKYYAHKTDNLKRIDDEITNSNIQMVNAPNSSIFQKLNNQLQNKLINPLKVNFEGSNKNLDKNSSAIKLVKFENLGQTTNADILKGKARVVKANHISNPVDIVKNFPEFHKDVVLLANSKNIQKTIEDHRNQKTKTIDLIQMQEKNYIKQTAEKRGILPRQPNVNGSMLKKMFVKESHKLRDELSSIKETLSMMQAKKLSSRINTTNSMNISEVSPVYIDKEQAWKYNEGSNKNRELKEKNKDSIDYQMINLNDEEFRTLNQFKSARRDEINKEDHMPYYKDQKLEEIDLGKIQDKSEQYKLLKRIVSESLVN